MPGLKQLEAFRNELSKLGNERQVTAEWGEVYEELPLPSDIPAQGPQINVDDLLASLGDSPASPPSDDLDIPLPESSASDFPAELELPGESRDFAGDIPPGDSSGGGFDLSALDNLPGLDDLFGPSSPQSDAPPNAPPPDFPSIPEPPSAEADLSRFDDLLASLPLDIPAAGNAPEFPPEEPLSPQPSRNEPSAADADSFALPEDLLAGFSSDIEDARSKAPEFGEDADMGFTLPDFDLTPGFETQAGSHAETDGESETEGGTVSESAPSVPVAERSDKRGLLGRAERLDQDAKADFSDVEELSELGEESAPGAPVDAIAGLEALQAAGIPNLDTMDFTPSFEVGESAGETADGIVGGDFPQFEAPPDFGLGDGAATAQGGDADRFGADFADFSIPPDLDVPSPDSSSVPGQGSADSGSLDGFDGFSLDEDFLKASIDAGSAAGDDFHIPGFSDFTSQAARPSLAEFPSGAGRKAAKKEIPLEISEDDFRRFLEELTSFPLNLRIAVEEYISGDAGTELQKMELVHSVLVGDSVRKIAKNLEGLLGRPIPIPKDFEKKTIEEYEREKSSLKYVFLNTILPAAILFTIVAVLSACTIFLSYQFIYRPLAAESLYKRGYAAIEDARYTQSIDLFDKAIRIWNKKEWYFKYARAFRDKKQYISAEMMYGAILDRFKNDKAAGLEYAEMLRSDLRNFEKAETILRRRVLDNFVNDKDALLLLGDTYLDWADEDGSKFELARQTYSSLIELYGNEDPYLARMMRYFIRTNNLAEVLPLKEHFMNKRAKLGGGDLVELSGYLLKKRYEPESGDSEVLRNRVEDVRTLLERAIKADPESPEAQYNMGRYFIYNYKAGPAKTSLSEALLKYESARSMSPRRVLYRIDAYRLLGELLADDKEYLKAQDIYSQGIRLYEDQRDNRTVRADPLVGKLYADFADIDYFISGDLDGALMNYEKSIGEMNDTPSVRFRIGYIRYQRQDYESAMGEFLRAYASLPGDRNLLFGFGNALFRRGDFFAAQGYYERLAEMLDAERIRKGIVLPQVRADHGAFVEEYMRAMNNLGVILDRVASRTGDSRKRARAIELLSESNRAWDALTRNQETMVRAQGSNLAFLNLQNIIRPRSDFMPELYQDIPRTLENEKILQQRSDQ